MTSKMASFHILWGIICPEPRICAWHIIGAQQIFLSKELDDGWEKTQALLYEYQSVKERIGKQTNHSDGNKG